MDVRKFPVRRSREEKDAFLQAVKAYAEGLGYTVSVEEGGFLKSRNIVIGDPDRAAVLLTAHYDTPAFRILPDIRLPGRPLLNLLLEILAALLLMVPAFLVYLLFWLFLGARAVPVFFLAYLGLLALQVFGPAEKHNESLTGSLECLLRVMRDLPVSARSRAAFVLFDHGEINRAGARRFTVAHAQAAWTRLTLHLDRLGSGTVLASTESKAARKAAGYHGLCTALGQTGSVETSLRLPVSQPSDDALFSCAVRLASGASVPGLGVVIRNERWSERQMTDGAWPGRLADALCGWLGQEQGNA